MLTQSAGLNIGIIAALTLAHSAYPPSQEVSEWTCQRDLRGPGDKLLYFQKFLSPNSGRDSYFIGFRGTSSQRARTTLYWNFSNTKKWKDKIDTVILQFDILNAPVSGDINANIYGNGRFLFRTLIFKDSWIQSHQNQQIEGTISLTPPYIPNHLNLSSISKLDAVIVDNHNRVISRVNFLLPDWPRVDRFVEDAAKELDLDSLDHENRCGQDGQVIEELPAFRNRSLAE